MARTAAPPRIGTAFRLCFRCRFSEHVLRKFAGRDAARRSVRPRTSACPDAAARARSDHRDARTTPCVRSTPACKFEQRPMAARCTELARAKARYQAGVDFVSSLPTAKPRCGPARRATCFAPFSPTLGLRSAREVGREGAAPSRRWSTRVGERAASVRLLSDEGRPPPAPQRADSCWARMDPCRSRML